jgi:transcriptional regulator with XRE-family HTH domain
MTRNDEQSPADANSRRRPWLIEARNNHNLTWAEAEILIKKRGHRLGTDQLQRAIEERRARYGLSQPDLAILIGCAQNEISKIETGERRRPDPDIAEAIGRVLRMTRDQVLFGGPQSKIGKIVGEVLEDEAVRMYQEPEPLELALNGIMLSPDIDSYSVAVDTLEPRWRKGDILLCHRAGAALDQCIGRECVAEIEGRRYVGLVEPGASPRIITLRRTRSNNATLIDKTPTWIGPIIAITFSG